MISIVVPVYNVEKYLDNCIDSILSQSYREYELLLIDDGSTDNSGNICDFYADKDSRIKVFHQKNGGVSAARSLGIRNAKYPYICFVDADDSIEIDYLKTLYTAADKNGADYVCCNAKNENTIDDKYLILEETNIDTFEQIIEAYFSKKQYAFVIWGKLFSKKIIQDIEFAPIKYGEDTLFVMTALSKAKRGYLLPYQGYNYRDNPSGAMSTAKKLQYDMDVLYSVEGINNVIEQCTGATIEKAIYRYEMAIYSTFSSFWDGNREQRTIAYQRLVESCANIDLSKCTDTRKKYIKIFRDRPLILLYILLFRNICRKVIKR